MERVAALVQQHQIASISMGTIHVPGKRCHALLPLSCTVAVACTFYPMGLTAIVCL